MANNQYPNKKLRGLQAGGTSAASVGTGDPSTDALLALLSGGGQKGLTFEQHVALQQLQNAPSFASVEAGTAQFRGQTEAKARETAMAFIADQLAKGQERSAQIAGSLQTAGFTAPGLLAHPFDEETRQALINALYTGQGLLPTMERENLRASAAQNPQDIVRLLYLTAAGREPGGESAALRSETQYNLPGVMNEEKISREKLAKSIPSVPRQFSFEELMGLLQPVLDLPEFGGADATGALDTGGGAQPADAASSAKPGKTVWQLKREWDAAHPGKSGGKVQPAAVPGGANYREPGAQSLALLHTLKRNTETYGRPDFTAQNRNTWRDHLRTLSTAELEQLSQNPEIMSTEGDTRSIMERRASGNQANQVNQWGQDVLYALGSSRSASKRSSRRARRGAEGIRTFDTPGFFLVGEGQDGSGIDAGHAEFLYAPHGTVVAPMLPGEKPTESAARNAVSEMLTHGERLRAAAEGATVQNTTNAINDLFRQDGPLGSLLPYGTPSAAQTGIIDRLKPLRMLPARWNNVVSMEDQLRQALHGSAYRPASYGTEYGIAPMARTVQQAVAAQGPNAPELAIFQSITGLTPEQALLAAGINPAIQQELSKPGTQFNFARYASLPHETQSAVAALLGSLGLSQLPGILFGTGEQALATGAGNTFQGESFKSVPRFVGV